MSKLRLICASALLSCTVVAAAVQEVAAAPKAIPMMNRYSKLKLDGICAANGGTSYGTSSGFYGCSGKNGNSVECDKNGNCTGYVNLQSANAPANITPESVLAQTQSPGSKTSGTALGGGAATTTP
jgi:hypothetical protein